MIKPQILIETFKAKDTNGQIHFISCYQNFTKSGYFDETPELLPGLKELWCASGPVNVIDDNTFQICATDAVVQKILK